MVKGCKTDPVIKYSCQLYIVNLGLKCSSVAISSIVVVHYHGPVHESKDKRLKLVTMLESPTWRACDSFELENEILAQLKRIFESF